MSHHTDLDVSTSKRFYKAPYSSHRPVPNIQEYEHTIQSRNKHATEEHQDPRSAAGNPGVFEATKERLLHSQDQESQRRQPYSSQNRNLGSPHRRSSSRRTTSTSSNEGSAEHVKVSGNSEAMGDGLSMATNESHGRRSDGVHVMQSEHQGRQVTDPVTHLPIYVHDWTSPELDSAPKNEMLADPERHNGEDNRLMQEERGQQIARQGMGALFPPPSHAATGKHLARIFKTALTAGLSFILGVMSLLLLLMRHLYVTSSLSQTNLEQNLSWTSRLLSSVSLLVIYFTLSVFVLWGLRTWVEKRIVATWEDGVWDAARAREKEESPSSVPESVQWLNSLLTSIWPLVNPDLFTSLADTLEDVMQASLPRLVRMVSVDDLGQGNEAIRILGIKWLPAGDAKKDISESDQTRETFQSQQRDHETPTTESSYIQDDNYAREVSTGNTEPADMMEGMEAEEGDFVNVEVGFSYRASTSSKSMKVKAKNAHLYLVFYLLGGVQFRELNLPNQMCSGL
ncbi:MAG: hypothetical protein Q9170_000147 [Blastenia crenularia]